MLHLVRMCYITLLQLMLLLNAYSKKVKQNVHLNGNTLGQTNEANPKDIITKRKLMHI